MERSPIAVSIASSRDAISLADSLAGDRVPNSPWLERNSSTDSDSTAHVNREPRWTFIPRSTASSSSLRTVGALVFSLLAADAVVSDTERK